MLGVGAILGMATLIVIGASSVSTPPAGTTAVTLSQVTNAIIEQVNNELTNSILAEEQSSRTVVNATNRVYFPYGTWMTNSMVFSKWFIGVSGLGSGLTNNSETGSIYYGMVGLHPDYDKSSNALACYFSVPYNADVQHSNIWISIDFMRGAGSANNFVFEVDMDTNSTASFVTFTTSGFPFFITNACPSGPNARSFRVEIPLSNFYGITNALYAGGLHVMRIRRDGSNPSDNNTGNIYPMFLNLSYLTTQ